MNKTLACIALAVLLIGFAIATSDIVVPDGSADVVTSVSTAPVAGDFSISLVSPVSGAVITSGSGSAQVSFSFKIENGVVSVNSASDEAVLNSANSAVDIVDTLACKVHVRESGGNVSDFSAVVDSNGVDGKADGVLSLGNYKWSVVCSDDSVDGTLINSDEWTLAIASPPAQPEAPSPPSQGTIGGNGHRGGSSSSLVPLNNRPASASNGNGNTNPTINSNGDVPAGRPSGITGAVIGVFGKSGALGIGIFITLVGVASLVVYNKRRLSVKK